MLARSADLNQFQGVAIIVAAVAYVGDPFISFRRASQPLNIHAKKARVKIDAPIEIADRHHRMPDAKSNIVYRFLAAHKWSPEISCPVVKTFFNALNLA
jgi:hypothetical protein